MVRVGVHVITVMTNIGVVVLNVCIVYHVDSLCTVIRNLPPPVSPIEEPDVSPQVIYPPPATSARALQDCGWYWGDLSRYTCAVLHY